MKLNETPVTIVGVLPKEAVLPPEAGVWTPLAVDPEASGSYYLRGYGRLKRGVTMAQAQAGLVRVHRLASQNPGPTSPILTPIRDRPGPAGVPGGSHAGPAI